jgi:hypothetical protein
VAAEEFADIDFSDYARSHGTVFPQAVEPRPQSVP